MSDLSSDPVAVKIMQLLERAPHGMRGSEFHRHFATNAFNQTMPTLVRHGHVSSVDVLTRTRPGRTNYGRKEPLYTLAKPLDTSEDVVGDAWERLDRAMALRVRADKAVELALHDIRVATRAAGASDDR